MPFNSGLDVILQSDLCRELNRTNAAPVFMQIEGLIFDV
jgi:hypothetical protein